MTPLPPMDQMTNSKIRQTQITKCYRIAVYSYLMPLGFSGLYLLDSIIFGLTKIFFLAIALGSLLPVAIIGLFFTVKGLIIAFKSNHYEKKDMGYTNLLMGIILFVGGILGFGLAYLMVAK